MAKIGVALFDKLENARGACNLLQSQGFDRSSIHLISNAQDRGVSAREIYHTLIGHGVPATDAGIYAEGVQRGGSLIYLRTEDKRAEEAADIMARFSFVDIDERSEMWKREGWAGFDLDSKVFGEEESEPVVETRVGTSVEGGAREEPLDNVVFEEAEEDLLVGKREVDAGGVRVKSYVTEEKVDEDIVLRDEHINVERRDVDRPLRAGSNTFEEREVEFRETHEEPVVSKIARVTEEVVVSKNVEEHTETIHDTVRHQNVRIDPIDASTHPTSTRFNRFDDDFRRHFNQHFSKSEDYSYDDYAIGYRYGATLGEDPQNRGKDWDNVAARAQTQWDERNYATWDKFKDAVRYGWQRVRGEHREEQQPTSGPPA